MAIAVALLTASPAAVQTRTRASLWYRGMPAGEPRQADLDAISAAGFSAVTWPTLYVSRALDLRRMADRASLDVVIRTDPVPLTPETALQVESYVDVSIPRTAERLYPSIVWRAIGHGSRIISFDPGVKEGTGFQDAAGTPASWLAGVSAVAHQVAANAVMIDTFKSFRKVKIDPAVAGLDVVIVDAVRSWVLVATNTSAANAAPADTYAYLPAGVPPAEWLNLFDGTTIAMLRQATGPRWHVLLGPGDVRVYVIGKVEG